MAKVTRRGNFGHQQKTIFWCIIVILIDKLWFYHLNTSEMNMNSVIIKKIVQRAKI